MLLWGRQAWADNRLASLDKKIRECILFLIISLVWGGEFLFKPHKLCQVSRQEWEPVNVACNYKISMHEGKGVFSGHFLAHSSIDQKLE